MLFLLSAVKRASLDHVPVDTTAASLHQIFWGRSGCGGYPRARRLSLAELPPQAASLLRGHHMSGPPRRPCRAMHPSMIWPLAASVKWPADAADEVVPYPS